MRGLRRLVAASFLLAVGASTSATPGFAADRIAAFTAGMETKEGLLTLHLDPESGKLYLVVDRLGEELLYTNTLATGLGTRPNRDRGQTNGYEMAVVRFERHGQRVFMVRANTRFVAGSGDPREAEAVRESFPTSVIASLPIVEQEGARLLVDATEFFLSDAWDLRGEVRRAGQGELRLDRDRSAISREHTRSFPRNTEVRSMLTFTTDSPHPQLEFHAPDGRFMTVEQHHSFVSLPERPLARRGFDPRTGHRPVVPNPSDRHSVIDFSQPFDGDLAQRFIYRWRLEPSDTAAYLRGELVEPVQPIVFYMDPGIAEPYRTAYRDGALAWNRILEAAGFRNALEVRDLPTGADPMDIRYSMIQTVHRSERGNSVGGQVWDPRTGEILFAIARIDSHRSFFTYNYYAGLLPAFAAQGIEPQLTAEEFAMARRRQHVPHEVGHALGFWHNFIASAQGRSSFMDYPAPLVRLDAGGKLDISEAYREGGGYNDTIAVRYSYAWYPTPEAEAEGLRTTVEDALARGYRYISDGHADASGSYADAHGYVEGGSAFEALDRNTRVRRILLEHFDERAIRPGEPMAWLNQRLLNVYLHHQPAVEAVTKYVGGMEYSYALRGDSQVPLRVITPAEQRRGLDRVVEALSPGELRVPDRILDLIPPVPWGFEPRDPWIGSPAGTALDPVAMARGFAQGLVDNLLHRERAARIAAFHARDPEQPSLDEVIRRLVEATWEAPRGAPGERAYLRATERAVLDALFTLASDRQATSDVRNAAERRLRLLARTLQNAPGSGAEDEAQRARARREIELYLSRGEVPPLRTGVIPMRFSAP